MSYHVEECVSICVGVICGGFLLFAYIRSRLAALLYLAVGNFLYLAYGFGDYGSFVLGVRLSFVCQLILTGLFVLASLITAIGMVALCIRLSKPTI